MGKVAIVTGGSSGIGLCTVQTLCAKGYIVYELSRREIRHAAGITHIGVDVTDEQTLHRAVSDIAQREGRIDLLVCCAGFGISGAAEFTASRDAHRLMEVNLFGTVYAVQAVLPVMRSQHSGTIVLVSSVAAPISIPFQSWYSVSKAAVSSYSAALREEVRPFGIRVCAVLPGDTKTGFTAAREKNPIGDDIYNGRISRSVASMEHDEIHGVSPQNVADCICKAAEMRSPKPYYTVGLPYQGAVMLSRLLPCRTLSWLVGKIYAK